MCVLGINKNSKRKLFRKNTTYQQFVYSRAKAKTPIPKNIPFRSGCAIAF